MAAGALLAAAAFVMGLLPIRFKIAMHTTGELHAWYHLALFIVLGALAMLASERPRTRLILVTSAALVGLGIELSEAAYFHGAFERYDVRTDFYGVALGAVSGWLLLRFLHRGRA